VLEEARALFGLDDRRAPGAEIDDVLLREYDGSGDADALAGAGEGAADDPASDAEPEDA
jgi:hypothetical protein